MRLMRLISQRRGQQVNEANDAIVANEANDTDEANGASAADRTNEAIGASAADKAIVVNKANVSN